MSSLTDIVSNAWNEAKDVYDGVHSSLQVMRKRTILNATGYALTAAVAATQIGCDGAGSSPSDTPPDADSETELEQAVADADVDYTRAGEPVTIRGSGYGVRSDDSQVTPDTIISFYDSSPVDTVVNSRTISTEIQAHQATKGDHTGSILVKKSSDGVSKEARDEVAFTLEETNAAPVMERFSVRPDSGAVPLDVDVEAVVTDPGGAVTYKFDVDGDGVVDVSNQSGEASFTYGEPGEYTAAAFAVRDGVSSDTLEQVVKAVEQDTPPSATVSVSPDTVDEGSSATLRVDGSDADNDKISRYQLDIGDDGSIEVDQSREIGVSREFGTPGSVTVAGRVRAGGAWSEWDRDELVVRDLVSLLGELQDNMSDAGVGGEVRVYTVGRELLDSDVTGSGGRYELLVPKDIGDVFIQARQVEAGEPVGFVRTVEYGVGDGEQQGVGVIRSVDYSNMMGLMPSEFREFMNDINIEPSGGLTKWVTAETAPAGYDGPYFEGVESVICNLEGNDKLSDSQIGTIQDIVTAYLPGLMNLESVSQSILDEAFVGGTSGYIQVGADSTVSGGEASYSSQDDIVQSGDVVFNPNIFFASEERVERGVLVELATGAGFREVQGNFPSIFYAGDNDIFEPSKIDVKASEIIYEEYFRPGTPLDRLLQTEFYSQ